MRKICCILSALCFWLVFPAQALSGGDIYLGELGGIGERPPTPKGECIVGNETRLSTLFAMYSPLGVGGRSPMPPNSTQPGDQDTARLLFAIPQKTVFAAADHLSNIYLIAADNSLEKYDSTGIRVARYTNNRLGRAAYADVSNPLKILLWFADFQTVVILDRTLNEMGQLQLSEAGFPAVRCVALAQDGNIWIYDDAGFRLLKITASGAILMESQPMNLVFPRRLVATCIRDNGEMVFLSDPEQGISTFDQYGYLRRTFPDLKTSQFEVTGDWLVFIDGGVLRFEHLSRFQSLKIALPTAAEGAIWASGRLIFVQKRDNLEVWTYRLL
ncbi:MAG: hypothetical protein IT262_21920 [Saprospiraceae bacterium]|nr:hypothetical protein [Saprospiraceae bacterium]